MEIPIALFLGPLVYFFGFVFHLSGRAAEDGRSAEALAVSGTVVWG